MLRGKPEQGQYDLASGDAEGEDTIDHGLVVHVQRRDGLWDAAALCAGEDVSREQEGDCQPDRRDEVGQPGMASNEMEEESASPVRCFGEPDGDCGHQNRADPENHTAPPQPR